MSKTDCIHNFNQANVLYQNATEELRTLKDHSWRVVATYGASIAFLFTLESDENPLEDVFPLVLFFGMVFTICYIYKQQSRLCKYRNRINHFYETYIPQEVAEAIDKSIRNRCQYGLWDAFIALAQILFVFVMGMSILIPDMRDWCP